MALGKRLTFFNSYFGKQFTFITNNSNVFSETNCFCDFKISIFDFENHGSFNYNSMKVSDSAIVKSLPMIFLNYLSSGVLPDNLKIKYYTSSQKQSKQLIQNYYPAIL